VRQVDVYRNKFKTPEELSSFVSVMKNSSMSDNDYEILINVIPYYECSDFTDLQELAANVPATIETNLNDVKVLTGKV
jgi:hypothetical protein